MSQMRDLPPIAGTIIWARQIERQLLTYMKRVEDVLGKGWELYAEGQKLQSESTAFRRKLDTRTVFEAWLHDINRRDMGVNGRLFEIVRLRGGGFQLAVNFDPQIITLFKEVRNLLWLGFQVPHAITNMAKDAKRVYPHAVSLMETVRTHGQTLDLVEHNKGIEWLVAEYRNEAQRMVMKGRPAVTSKADVRVLLTSVDVGMNIGWEHFASQYDTARFVSSDGRDTRHIQFVREFASVVSVLQVCAKVPGFWCAADGPAGQNEQCYRLVQRHLARGGGSSNMFLYLGSVHRATGSHSGSSMSNIDTCSRHSLKQFPQIDRLNLEGYANLDHWVAELDKKIEGILLQRLKHVAQVWCAEFDRSPDDGELRRDPVPSKRRGDKQRGEKVSAVTTFDLDVGSDGS